MTATLAPRRTEAQQAVLAAYIDERRRGARPAAAARLVVGSLAVSIVEGDASRETVQQYRVALAWLRTVQARRDDVHELMRALAEANQRAERALSAVAS